MTLNQIVGHKFQFRAEPSEWWDGIVDGEVFEVDEPNRFLTLG